MRCCLNTYTHTLKHQLIFTTQLTLPSRSCSGLTNPFWGVPLTCRREPPRKHTWSVLQGDRCFIVADCRVTQKQEEDQNTHPNSDQFLLYVTSKENNKLFYQVLSTVTSHQFSLQRWLSQERVFWVSSGEWSCVILLWKPTDSPPFQIHYHTSVRNAPLPPFSPSLPFCPSVFSCGAKWPSADSTNLCFN